MLMFVVEEVDEKGKEVVTNGLGVGLEYKNSNAWLSEIEVMVHVNKMAHP